MKSLKDGIAEYIGIKQAMGFTFERQADNLRKFSNFAEKKCADVLTVDLAVAWARSDEKLAPWLWAQRLCDVRLFSEYWSTIDTRTEIPDRKLLPFRYKRSAPYIYTEEEVRKILTACAEIDSPESIRPHTYTALYGLIAVTGMRGSEAISLTNDDVDLERGIITIRRTKFNKTRAVPLDMTVTEKLREYVEIRRKLHPQATSPRFFITHKERPVSTSVLHWTWVSLTVAVGLRKYPGGKGPRVHDLRHTFAVKTIENWYKAGADVDRVMPVLSTYMGHAQPTSTYWYLTATPTLMALAGKRFEEYLEDFTCK